MSVASASAPLAYFREGKSASVVILDLHLPGMDGRELLRELRADARFAGIPVVVFSGDPGDVPDVAARVRKGKDDPDVHLNAREACLKR